MLTAWRMVPVPHGADAFTGEGARLFGGRWNSAGVPLVYGSSTVSLAMLETLVHINPQLPRQYMLYEVRFDASLVEEISLVKMSTGWDAEPPGLASMSVGDEWVRAGRSVVLGVPSVLTREKNYLLNPRHKDFRRVKIGPPAPFTFDPRLLKK